MKLCNIKTIRWLVKYGPLSSIFVTFLYIYFNLRSTINKTTKHILIWTENGIMFPYRHEFSRCKCKINHCTFTTNKDLFDGDYTKFDAIFFHENDLGLNNKPVNIAKDQIFIFGSLESSYNYPACELYNDNFYNWTFTYRIDSDILWNYFFVRNLEGRIVAPKTNVTWEISSEPIKPSIKDKLKTKTKAAAWLVSNCDADSLRDTYLSNLQKHLYFFSLSIDVYGLCNNEYCDGDCGSMFSRDYFFYMAFENSIAEDYVTEKVLHGYLNNAVPIVYGGANYSRFLPPGSYLNARDYHPYNLAHIIKESIKYPKYYERFFKWTNTYTIESAEVRSPDHPFCDLCAALHSKRALHAPAYKQFRQWWNGLDGMKLCLPEKFWNETSVLNVDGTRFIKMY